MSSRAPLQGVRVLDLTRLLPGPMATLHLADLGADVIKIEDLGAGDYASPAVREQVNRNKRGMRIDLKQAEGAELLLKLCESADVLVEGFRPGVMARLGLGYDVVRRRNPRLVYCSISGYGQTGSLSQKAGHDLNYCGFAGVADQIGTPSGELALSNLPVADLLGGEADAAQTRPAGLRLALHLLEQFFAALRLGGTGGAGAETVDVGMQVGDLALLLLEHRDVGVLLVRLLDVRVLEQALDAEARAEIGEQHLLELVLTAGFATKPFNEFGRVGRFGFVGGSLRRHAVKAHPAHGCVRAAIACGHQGLLDAPSYGRLFGIIQGPDAVSAEQCERMVSRAECFQAIEFARFNAGGRNDFVLGDGIHHPLERFWVRAPVGFMEDLPTL